MPMSKAAPPSIHLPTPTATGRKARSSKSASRARRPGSTSSNRSAPSCRRPRNASSFDQGGRELARAEGLQVGELLADADEIDWQRLRPRARPERDRGEHPALGGAVELG